MNTLFKKSVAEFVGTFVLVFAACGVAALTGGDLVATALAFGLVIVAMAYSVGRISGCHINPAVSLGCLLTKRMTLKEFGAYVCAQFLGGIAGGLSLFGILKMANVTVLGNACNYAPEVSVGGIIGAVLVEVILTAIFVYTILNVTDENSGAGKKAGLIIGLTLTLVHLVGIRITGTSVNPARSFATALSDLVYNGNTESLAQVAIFLLAPLAGAALAALLFKCLHSKKEETK